jgi:beta-glucanase (GH16 family)
MTFDPNNPTASGMVLTFDDEFTTSSISSDGVANGTKWNNHIWFHSPAPGDFSVSNGVMNILGDPSDPWAANMMTVNSAGQGFTQEYGYFEADIEVPAGQGTWPSFWGFSENSILGQNVPASEFDILEGQGSAPTYYWSTLHQSTNGAGGVPDATNSNATINSGITLSAGFHRFGMLWDPNSNYVTFYLDGKPMIQVPKWSTTDSSAIALILGSGIGDMIGTNQPNASTPDPADMKVDYVRVYQFASLDPTAVQPDPVSPAAGNTDPVALVNALGQGTGATPPTSPAPSGTSTAPASGGTSASITVSGDMYSGNPQIAVLIDGKQVGTYSITAHHSQGQTQTIALPGTYDPTTAHTVQVQFLNDAWDGTPNVDGHDRNAYVESVTVNGVTVSGQNFTSNNASLGEGSLDPNAAVLLADGTATYTVAADPPAQVPTLTVQAASGTQGNAIPLSISAAQASSSLATADLTVAVSGLGGATLNHGTHNADGSYTLHLSDLQGLTLTPASGFSGALSLAVTATDTEANSTASTPAQTLGVTVAPTPVTTPPVSAPSGSSGSLSLTVSGDMFNGDPQIAVLVDGKQVGTYDVSAHHSQGQTETINVSGTFDPTLAHQVQVQFLNDGWDGASGDGNDRNVYVESVTLNGTTIQGQNFASNNASLGYDSLDPHAAVMLGNGTSAYNFAPNASGLSLKVAGDMYNGDPQIAVLVDGKQVGTYDVSAHHSQGQTETITIAGNFDPSVAHTVQVQFLNDSWDGSTPNVDGHDRNVYVESVTLNGTTIQGQNFTSNNASLGEDSLDPHSAVMLANGTTTYTIASPEPVIAPTSTSGGHNTYTYTAMSQAGGQITSFNPASDFLNLTQLLKSVGYSGTNPIGDHIVDLAANANGGTAVMIDPTGHDPSHATMLVTLDHILPQSVTAADILHA